MMAKILIVDDDPMMAALEKSILKLYCHYEVESVSEVRGVMGKLALDEFDLALVDVSIQEEADGVRLVKEIKASQRLRHLPVLLVTAHAHREGEREKLIKASGADDCLAKPFTGPKDLAEPVQHWVSEGLKRRVVS